VVADDDRVDAVVDRQDGILDGQASSTSCGG
jgi:hypothetical protein